MPRPRDLHLSTVIHRARFRAPDAAPDAVLPAAPGTIGVPADHCPEHRM